jgi:hypothetical protein
MIVRMPDQEEEAERDSPGLSEREKAIAAVQTWKSRPPDTASGVSGVEGMMRRGRFGSAER